MSLQLYRPAADSHGSAALESAVENPASSPAFSCGPFLRQGHEVIEERPRARRIDAVRNVGGSTPHVTGDRDGDDEVRACPTEEVGAARVPVARAAVPRRRIHREPQPVLVESIEALQCEASLAVVCQAVRTAGFRRPGDPVTHRGEDSISKLVGGLKPIEQAGGRQRRRRAVDGLPQNDHAEVVQGSEAAAVSGVGEPGPSDQRRVLAERWVEADVDLVTRDAFRGKKDEAVRGREKDARDMSVPEQKFENVPGSNSATTVPTFGCRLPSKRPNTIAPAGAALINSAIGTNRAASNRLHMRQPQDQTAPPTLGLWPRSGNLICLTSEALRRRGNDIVRSSPGGCPKTP